MTYALQILADHDRPGTWRWVLMTVDADRIADHSAADCEFPTYTDALNAGTLASPPPTGSPMKTRLLIQSVTQPAEHPHEVPCPFLLILAGCASTSQMQDGT